MSCCVGINIKPWYAPDITNPFPGKREIKSSEDGVRLPTRRGNLKRSHTQSSHPMDLPALVPVRVWVHTRGRRQSVQLRNATTTTKLTLWFLPAACISQSPHSHSYGVLFSSFRSYVTPAGGSYFVWSDIQAARCMIDRERWWWQW